jgi:hypothetical protein
MSTMDERKFRDLYDAQCEVIRELRAELDVARARIMRVTRERDTLRDDVGRDAILKRQNAQTLAEVQALGAKLRGES